MSWVVYILRCADNTLYTGITNDIGERIASHEKGAGAKYTRGRGPFSLVHTEECIDRAAATKRESEIKRMKRKEKEQLFQASGRKR